VLLFQIFQNICYINDINTDKNYIFTNNTGYFTSGNEPGGIENGTHNTLERKPGHGCDKNIRLFLLMYCGLHFLFRRVHYHP
jgi:hypothetical protein